MKDIVILGGPNGAGKTTVARVLLREFLHQNEFVNADEIARRLSPTSPESSDLSAGRLMLDRMRLLIRQGSSFAFETTCAGRTYAKLLRDCKDSGWRISLLYLWIPSAEYSFARVARRVSQGGHAIPPEVIYRRYGAGLWNMRHLYLPLADDATIYDNRDESMRLIARRSSAAQLEVFDRAIWTKIEEETEWER